LIRIKPIVGINPKGLGYLSCSYIPTRSTGSLLYGPNPILIEPSRPATIEVHQGASGIAVQFKQVRRAMPMLLDVSMLVLLVVLYILCMALVRFVEGVIGTRA